MTLFQDLEEQFGDQCALVLYPLFDQFRGPELDDVMNAASAVLEEYGFMCHGIEPIQLDENHELQEDKGYINTFYWSNTVALYINRGDTYDATVVYDVAENSFTVSSWGDWYENNVVDVSEKNAIKSVAEELYRLDIEEEMASAVYQAMPGDHPKDVTERSVRQGLANLLNGFVYIPESEAKDMLTSLGGRIVVINGNKTTVFDKEPDVEYFFDNWLHGIFM